MQTFESTDSAYAAPLVASADGDADDEPQHTPATAPSWQLITLDELQVSYYDARSYYDELT